MAAETEINPVADRRRRRRRALLLALIPALLASAFFADYLRQGGDEAQASAHQIALARKIAVKASRHRATHPMGEAGYRGQGGPEESGPWIDENGGNVHGWLFEDHKPIDQLASSAFILPGRLGGLPGRGGSGPGGGIGGGGGSGGGGPGGGIVTCVKDDGEGGTPSLSAVSELCASEKKADEQPQGPIEPITTIVTGSAPTGPTGSGPNTDTSPNRDLPETAGPNLPSGPSTPNVPVSAVPEPENWVMMIAGFLLTGVALRGRRAFSKAKARAIRIS